MNCRRPAVGHDKHHIEATKAERPRKRRQYGDDPKPRLPLELNTARNGAVSQTQQPGQEPLNDYIIRWLEQTSIEIKATDGDKTEKDQLRKTKILQTKDTSTFHDAKHTSPAHRRSVPARGKRSSSDSSLLAAPRMKKVRSSSGCGQSDRHKLSQERVHRGQKSQPEVESSDGKHEDNSSRKSKLQHQTYEKRARHKTREDRYEPKKTKRRGKPVEERTTLERKPQKKGRVKVVRKSGADLIRTFSSENIGQERLTIRPNLGLGLFRNGRASSTVKRRGLPDLAFSEMDFLQKANNYLGNIEDDRVASKWRNAETRKKSRTHDEITTFFKPERGIMLDTETNDRDHTSVVLESEYCSNVGRSLSINKPSRSNREYVGHRKKGSGQLSQMNNSDSQLQAQGIRDPKGDIYQRQISTTELSAPAASHVTWSETQESFARERSNRLEQSNEGQRLAPCSDRRRLEQTRIFKDTGIGNNSTLQGPLMLESPSQEIFRHRPQHSNEERSSKRITEASSTEALDLDLQSSPSTSGLSNIGRKIRRPRSKGAKGDGRAGTRCYLQPSKELAPLCKTNSGKLLNQVPQDTEPQMDGQRETEPRLSDETLHEAQGVDIGNLKDAEDRPVSREEIAKRARISYATNGKLAANGLDIPNLAQTDCDRNLARTGLQDVPENILDDASIRSSFEKLREASPSAAGEGQPAVSQHVQAMTEEQRLLGQNRLICKAANEIYNHNIRYNERMAGETPQGPLAVLRMSTPQLAGDIDGCSYPLGARVFESWVSAFGHPGAPRNYWANCAVPHSPGPQRAPRLTYFESASHFDAEQAYYTQELYVEDQNDDCQQIQGEFHPNLSQLPYVQGHGYGISNDGRGVENKQKWGCLIDDAVGQFLHEEYAPDSYTEHVGFHYSAHHNDEQMLVSLEQWDGIDQDDIEYQDQFENDGAEYYAMDPSVTALQHDNSYGPSREDIDMNEFWRPHRQY